jgi:hypothetical protein
VREAGRLPERQSTGFPPVILNAAKNLFSSDSRAVPSHGATEGWQVGGNKGNSAAMENNKNCDPVLP